METKNSKKSFLLHLDVYDAICDLPIREKGVLLDSIFLYIMGKEVPKMAAATKMAFSFIRNSIDRNNEKYEEICQKRSEAGIKGNRKRWGKIAKIANATFVSQKSQTSQMIANVADSDSDSDIKRKINKKKNLTTEDKEKLLTAFNETLNTNSRTLEPYQANILYWLSFYSVEDMVTAIRHIPQHDFWKDKMKISIFFRQTDRQRNPVDYIGDLLNVKKKREISLN